MTTFALDLSKAIEKAKDQAELIVKKTTIQLFSSVIEKSPVDTGRFRANWNVSFGAFNPQTTEEVDPSGSQSKSKVYQALANYQLKDQSVFLGNSLPYAERLENGWSKQAPAGMVRLSILEANKALGA
jgi:hypothetical protein